MHLYKGGGTSAKSRSNINVASGTLNQFVLDFENNSNNIISAIQEAHSNNVKVLGLPELAICGYCCQDHFFERETFVLSYYVLKNIVESTESITKNMIVAVGCPIIHRDVRYNCVVFFGNGKIILIRPKSILADDGNYREARWFTPWNKDEIEDFYFEENNTLLTKEKQKNIPFGIGIINCNGIIIGAEICEELWISDNIGSKLYLSGVDILINSSGSHFEKGKQEEKRETLIKGTTRKSGGVYIYSNLEGCDGDTLYFDGGSLIALNGEIKCKSIQYYLKDVQINVCNINLDDILTYRSRSNAHQLLSSKQTRFPELKIDIELTDMNSSLMKSYNFKYYDKLPKIKYNSEKVIEDIPIVKISSDNNTDELVLHNLSNNEKLFCERMKKDINMKSINEICNTAACWLFDYLERRKSNGYFICIDNNSDSISTLCILFRMCELMLRHIHYYNDQKSRVYKYLKDIHSLDVSKIINMEINEAVKIISKKILFTMYFHNNNDNNLNIIEQIADQIGTNHNNFNIQNIIEKSIYEITKIPYYIINDEALFMNLIIQKNKFIKNNIKLRDTDKYKLYIDTLNSKIDELRNKYLTNYKLINTNDYQELEKNIFLNKDSKIKLELSTIASTLVNNHVENYKLLIVNNKELSEITFIQLKKNFKSDIEYLNEIYSKLKNTEFTTENTSNWDSPVKDIHERIKMMMSYIIPQVSTNTKNLIHLSSLNSDDINIGNYTKYGLSNCDLNPIGNLSKLYIQRILIVFGQNFDKIYSIIIDDISKYQEKDALNISKFDESGNIFKYTEIFELNKLMSNGYGPLDTFIKISTEPNDNFDNIEPKNKLEKTCNFNNNYRINRHKSIVLPPNIHLISTTINDNKYNMRPFLYPYFYSSIQYDILNGINI